MADKTHYDGWVVVDESEWKFDYGIYEMKGQSMFFCDNGHLNKSSCATCDAPIPARLNPRVTKQSLKMGLVEWNIAFNDQAKTVEFSCQSVAEGTVNEVHAELVGFHRTAPKRTYQKLISQRHKFTRATGNSLPINLQMRDNVFTIRILKNRAMFPDFTVECTSVVSRMVPNGKLRVCDQVFYVNKQLLAMHSEYFQLMYDSPFVEANQEEVELKHEGANAAEFHDFLLTLFVAEALPNSKNVAALSNLAKIYQADNVRDKCHRHLWSCREMPIEQRYMLAGELGFNGLQNSLIANASPKEAKRMLTVATKKAFALTK